MSQLDLDLEGLLGGGASPLPAAADPVPASVAAGAGMSTGGVAYDGSNTFDKLAMWRPAIRSADADILPEKSTLDARARDTIRNDAYVAGATSIWKDSIVGARYMLNAKPETKVLWGKEDETWTTEYQEEVETKFNLWAESQQNWADAARINSFTGLIRLSVGVFLAGGEVTAVAKWMPNDGRPFRTALQMIDADRLSTPQDASDRLKYRAGVERDSNGAPIAYHFRNRHPSEGPFHDWSSVDNYHWTRIAARMPWGRRNVMHIFEQMRPDQSRGFTAMASALNEMRMTKHHRKTQLERAIIAGTYAASIETELPNDVQAALGVGYSADGNATTQWMLDYLESVKSYSGGAKNLHMDGAQIPVMPPGAKLNLQNPGAIGPDANYEMSLIRYIAASLDLSYEQVSRDYTNTNYSSARAAMGETWKAMQSRKKTVADRAANFIYLLWLEEAINNNQIEALKRRNVPKFYEGLNAEAYSACEWIGAGQGQIDPLKETQAAGLRLKFGLSTKEVEVARMHGGDYRNVARQIKRERDLDTALGNPSVYDQDAKDMTNALSGTPQEKDK